MLTHFFFSCNDYSWAEEHDVSPHTTPFHDYLISIYWAAATTTTVGYGDISAHTPQVSTPDYSHARVASAWIVVLMYGLTCHLQEMVYALIIQLMGVMLYGYCLGAIAASLTNVVGSR